MNTIQRPLEMSRTLSFPPFKSNIRRRHTRVIGIRGRALGRCWQAFFLSVLLCTNNTRAQRPKAAENSIETKVDTLLSRMTVEEKIGQLNQSFHFIRGEATDQRVIRGEIGSFNHEIDPAEINRLQHLAVDKSRLHIPLVFMMDVVHGFGVTFPVPLAMAASWDMPMIEQDQSMAAKEARKAGLQWNASPMLDIVRDPRWGRVVEGAGEDPFLGSKVAVAQVRGFQGMLPVDDEHMVVSLKHFAGYGFSEGGRDHDEALIPETVLRNVVLKPFKAATDAGAGSLMSAYMDLNDVPASGNRWLLTEVLRDEWHYPGIVISDNNAVTDLVPHGFAKDQEDAGKRALHAGVDMQMSNFGDVSGLLAAAHDHTLNIEELDRSVRRVLRLKFELGLFDHPYVDETKAAVSDKPKLLEMARVSAERSAVLLKNSDGLLPLRPGAYPKVALIGSLADNKQDTLGPWLAGEDYYDTVTIRQALEQSGKFQQVAYAPGVQIRRLYPSPFDRKMKEKPAPPWTDQEADAQLNHAVEVAKGADLVIAVLGEEQNMTGESASRASLDLPGRQEELLEKLYALKKPIVLVLMAGRPLTIDWAADHIPAILDLWFPGTEGGDAAVDLLFGNANPGGKLPITWPRNANQIPTFYGHTLTQDPQGQSKRYWDVPSVPLFAFGYGLSYTHFSYANVRVLEPEVHIGQPVTIEAEVTNTGSVAGDAVPQLYLHQQYGGASRPARELKGFERINLQHGEKRTIRFVVPPQELAYWSEATHRWTQDATTFSFGVGDDSTAPLTGTFTVVP